MNYDKENNDDQLLPIELKEVTNSIYELNPWTSLIRSNMNNHQKLPGIKGQIWLSNSIAPF
jgi:hypothetical protein